MARSSGRGKRDYPIITKADLVEQIASCTTYQKTDVFRILTTLEDILKTIITSDTKPDNLEIKLLGLGNLMFKKKKGLKKGDVYKKPNFNKKGVMETIVVDKDHGDYERLWLEVSPTLKETLKEKSRKRYFNKQLRDVFTKNKVNADGEQ
jgi:nucleoid DNA-binding protein